MSRKKFNPWIYIDVSIQQPQKFGGLILIEHCGKDRSIIEAIY